MRTNEELLALTRAKAARIVRQRRMVGATGTVAVIGLLIATTLTVDRGHRVEVGTTGETTTSVAQTTSGSTEASTDTTAVTHESPTSDASALDAGAPDVAVSIDPPQPVSGDLVTFTVTLRNRPLAESVSFELTEEGPIRWGTGNQLQGDCNSAERSTTVETVHFTQRLRKVGVHRHFILLEDCSNTFPDSRAPDVLIPIEFSMSGPAAPGNGPEPPYWPSPVTFFPPDAPLTIWQNLQGGDTDGILDHYTVDWGDGSPAESVAAKIWNPPDPPDCSPGGEYNSTSGYAQPEHTYGAPGTYTLTLSIFSVDCDGGTMQTRTEVKTITVPLPPTSTPSTVT